MSIFSFLFCVKLGELILRHTNNLGKTLQCKKFSTSECQEAAKLVVNTLEKIRNEAIFNLFWEKIGKHQGYFEVDLPVLS